MITPKAWISLLALSRGAVASPTPSSEQHTVSFEGLFNVASESVHNIHVSFADVFPHGSFRVVFGDCESTTEDDHHHEVASLFTEKASAPDRLVWLVPRDVKDGCLHAFSNGRLLGRSEPVTFTEPLRKREDLSEISDSNGLWFDGVKYLEASNLTAVKAKEAKEQKIAIVGGGMSGLLTSLLLTSVGMTNWHIIESSQRVGGRIRTKYLNGTGPDDYQYQEMGPMRFPVEVTYPDTNETLDIQDHKMVFQLAEVLNEMNGNDSDLAVKFIPWIQSSKNTPANSRGYRLPGNRIPSSAQLAEDPSVLPAAVNASDVHGAELGGEFVERLLDVTPERMRNISANVFKAHRDAIDRGLFQWSEAAYLKYQLGLDSDTVDFMVGSGSVLGGSGNSPMWGEWYDSVYFAASKWLTIDKGLESLPKAFAPHIKDKITYGRKIDGIEHNETTSKVSLTWRESPLEDAQKDEYDYAVVAVPFSKVRLWRRPAYSNLLTRAIGTLNYQQSCKVALHYETRFWESQENPIFGGCGSTDIPGIGSVCYPAYEINSTRPGVILASYASGIEARSVAALSDEDHIAMVQRAMVEVHGPIANEQWTGSYDRQCSITHAWIFSALESSVRGTAQLLLDMGLVDEAKHVVETWMARWITV